MMHSTRFGQSLVTSALRLRAAQASRLAEPRSPATSPGTSPTLRLPEPRPQFACTPRPGTTACNVFDLATANVVALPAGIVVPAWQGLPTGFFGGGPTIRVRLPNGHFAIAYTRDFVRVQTDRVGVSLVEAAQRLDAARRAQTQSEVLQRAQLPSPFDPARARRPGEDGTLNLPDPNARPRLSPVEAAMRLSAALDRAGIPHGRVEVTHPRGVQIWSAPQGEYRPGTGIPLMERVVRLPQGAILTVTPDPRIIEAAVNSPEGFGMAFYSYAAQWNLRDVDQKFSPATFERLGVPTSLLRGSGYVAGPEADRLLPLHRRGDARPT